MKKLILILFLGLQLLAKAQNKKSEVILIQTTAECDQCKKRLESNISYEKGVKFCKLDLNTKVLKVTYNGEKTEPEKLRAAISKLGYDADAVKADSVAYSKLPECCKVGGTDHE